MRKLLLLVCIGILPDIAMAHFFELHSCKVPLTVLSGNVECSLTSFDSNTIKCKIVKFSHITDTFEGVPSKDTLKLAMTSLCMKDEKCFQAFDCEKRHPLADCRGIDITQLSEKFKPAAIAANDLAAENCGCHLNPLTGEYHCH